MDTDVLHTAHAPRVFPGRCVPAAVRRLTFDENISYYFLLLHSLSPFRMGRQCGSGKGTRRREAYRIINREFSEPIGIVAVVAFGEC